MSCHISVDCVLAQVIDHNCARVRARKWWFRIVHLMRESRATGNAAYSVQKLFASSSSLRDLIPTSLSAHLTVCPRRAMELPKRSVGSPIPGSALVSVSLGRIFSGLRCCICSCSRARSSCFVGWSDQRGVGLATPDVPGPGVALVPCTGGGCRSRAFLGRRVAAHHRRRACASRRCDLCARYSAQLSFPITSAP